MFESSLEELRDLPYKSISHTFNRAVIAAYNNVEKNGIIVNDGWFAIRQQKKFSVFLTDKQDLTSDVLIKDGIIYSENKLTNLFKPREEVVYVLDDFFKEPTKEIRRLIRFKDRKEVDWKETDNERICLDVYDRWVSHKQADPRVFQISFNPGRYARTYKLKSEGYNIYQIIVTTNRCEPYGVINFAIEEDRAYELSFCSDYLNKEKKLINDQNEAIIVSALHDLYGHGIKTVNLGTDAGIKGLKFFKKQFPYTTCQVYSRFNIREF